MPNSPTALSSGGSGSGQRGLSVVGPDDLLARARKKLADKDWDIRGNGASMLAKCGLPAEEVLPELEKMLKSESEWE